MEIENLYNKLNGLELSELFKFINNVLKSESKTFVFECDNYDILSLVYKDNRITVMKDDQITISFTMSMYNTHYFIHEKKLGYLGEVKINKMTECLRRSITSSIL